MKNQPPKSNEPKAFVKHGFKLEIGTIQILKAIYIKVFKNNNPENTEPPKPTLDMNA